MLTVGRTEALLRDKARKQGALLAALIDPEDFTLAEVSKVALRAEESGASIILIGGSTIADQRHVDDVVTRVKKHITIPVILFPGNITGISRHADAILFSTLLNSSNTYFVIGAQAIGSLQVYRSGLEAIPMAYLVFGADSTTGFVGQVRPIPYNKPSITIMYALAAQYLGLRALYLEAGSGSSSTIPAALVSAVRKYFDGLLIVGGGITDPKVAKVLAEAGADVIVVGNLLRQERSEKKLVEISKAIKRSL